VAQLRPKNGCHPHELGAEHNRPALLWPMTTPSEYSWRARQLQRSIQDFDLDEGSGEGRATVRMGRETVCCKNNERRLKIVLNHHPLGMAIVNDG
jgi:hypothetical protein